ncbi:unnamed protein product [Pelagomonas calceolata]|uniref:Uncharacterized protein n=4 Tax=Pelagomonas calceolata TaxID=35677 RepID=A0A8J2X2U6_9STRA|nr:unnamed protein product [Pelagomonas calceolata]
MGRSKPTGRKATTAKKGAAPGLSRHFSEEQLAPLKAKSARARRAKSDEPLKLDEFKGKAFLWRNKHGKVDEKKMAPRKAVVDAAIEDGRKNAGITNSTELANHVFDKTGFLRWHRGKNVGAALGHYVTAQCAEKDRSKKEKPWWDGVTNLAKATKAQLVVVERDGEGKAITAWSCQKKHVHYPADSGLTTARGSIGFSVEKYGEAGATLLAFEESQSALGLLKKFKKQVSKLPKKVREDIAARKASGGAVAQKNGRASTNIEAGIQRVEVRGVTKLRVRYGPRGALTHEDFPDTADGLCEARAFVYANLPLAVRRAQNAANLEVLPLAESLDELPYRQEDFVAAHAGTATPPAVGDAASLRAARLKRRGASKGAADGGDDVDDAPPPSKRHAAGDTCVPAEEARADDADDAPSAFGFGDDDDAAAPEPSSEPSSKRRKGADGVALSVKPGVAEVLDQLRTADAVAANEWLAEQGLTSVHQVAELRNNARHIEAFLDAAKVSGDAARELAAQRIRDLATAAAPSDDRAVDDAPAAVPPPARSAKRGRSGANGGAASMAGAASLTPRLSRVDPQQDKYRAGLDASKRKPQVALAPTLKDEEMLHRITLLGQGIADAHSYVLSYPASREQCVGMCNPDARLRRIHLASFDRPIEDRLEFINECVWVNDDGALGRDLLCREYGIPEAVGLTDAQFAALGGLWTIDGMWNKIELPLEALVLRPMTAHLRWMYEGSTTMKEEVKRYYGAPRFKIATRSASRATTKAKELEQACL